MSAQLLTGIERVQRVHRIWRTDERSQAYPIFRDTKVLAHPKSKSPSTAVKGVASFFSGGVDSFYTLLANEKEVTHLIYIHGFEGQSDSEDVAVTLDNVREAARKLNKELVEVQTNARDLFQEYVSWAHYHGSLLASVALLLAPQFQKVFIPSTHDVAQLFPWGSHPEVDPHFSIEGCALVHDRCDVTRLEKTATLAASSVALEHLRVCWRPAFNCGQCGKCVRTRLGLQALGVSAASFSDGPLSLRPELRSW